MFVLLYKAMKFSSGERKCCSTWFKQSALWPLTTKCQSSYKTEALKTKDSDFFWAVKDVSHEKVLLLISLFQKWWWFWWKVIVQEPQRNPNAFDSRTHDSACFFFYFSFIQWDWDLLPHLCPPLLQGSHYILWGWRSQHLSCCIC